MHCFFVEAVPGETVGGGGGRGNLGTFPYLDTLEISSRGCRVTAASRFWAASRLIKNYYFLNITTNNKTMINHTPYEKLNIFYKNPKVPLEV